ncbi:MAG: hypothetical protein H5U38_11720 [Calditrichaeota bacterium]|nr:hypothetical protein [Calditrichota bacterium]
MKTRTAILALGSFFLLCSKNVTEERGPAAPILLPPPDELAVVEKGIDAVPEADAIQLDWLAPEGEEVAGFRLYRRTGRSGPFLLLKSFKAQDSTYVDAAGIEIGTRYFYFMTAVDYSGRESAPSDTVDYMLVPKAFNLHCSAGLTPVFRWHVQDYPAQYVLKLFDLSDGSKVWFSLVPSSYQGQEEVVTYNWDGAAAAPALVSGRQYRWRVDVVGVERNSGSESAWSRFTASP